MIRIQRPAAEPVELTSIRATQLTRLQAQFQASGQHPRADDITGYRIVAKQLHTMQYGKCCYCERPIPKGRNDTEHYRPKAGAIHKPGSAPTHGYWWLAHTWENLLYACPNCNQSYKRMQFPLHENSVPLAVGQMPPGQEQPLLLDPAGPINPVEHIQFVLKRTPHGQEQWRARPRNQSQFGKATIEVCGLDKPDSIDMHTRHVESHIWPVVNEFRASWPKKRALAQLYRVSLHFFTAQRPFAALNYDALRHYVPDDDLFGVIGKRWPTIDQIGR